MGSPEVMPSTRYVHLPTEVLSLIAEFVLLQWREQLSPSLQSRFYAFCLVSRQWYSAGIEFLYSEPELCEGNTFALFTRTVCPPVRSRERKVDLGSLVQILNLSRLVHHSSNSVTARLLGRVKKRLITFIAPRVSFAINSLAPLSKCRELVHLDLSLVVEPIPFGSLKKAVSGLNKLESIKLPRSMFITDDESGEDWPTSLTDVQVGGAFVRQEMTSFRWPQNIEELALCGCENLTPEVLECIFINEQLSTTLTRLAIHGSNRHMFADRDASSLARLRNLKTLQIPIDLLYRLQLLPASDTFSPLIPIRELELTPSYDNDFTSKFVVEDLCRALRLNLSRVCSLGISLECLELIPESTFGKIDKWVWKNIDRCPEEELDSIFELGVYIIDPPALC